MFCKGESEELPSLRSSNVAQRVGFSWGRRRMARFGAVCGLAAILSRCGPDAVSLMNCPHLRD
jgi:hypothetical protein